MQQVLMTFGVVFMLRSSYYCKVVVVYRQLYVIGCEKIMGVDKLYANFSLKNYYNIVTPLFVCKNYIGKIGAIF